MINRMKQKLTKGDIKILRYQCRPVFLIAFMIFFMGSLVAFALNVSGEYTNPLDIITGTVLAAVIIAYSMTHKYIEDIRHNEKEIITKIISAKEFKVDYEAGSGGIMGRDMNPFDNYSIIIDNYQYRVKKDFYESCQEGDKVFFHIASISKFRIKMELAKNTEEQENRYKTKL